MQPLGFVAEYTRALAGRAEPPDPFEGMTGPLDSWWDDAFVMGDLTEDSDEPLRFITEQGMPEPEKVRSWDKQAQDIIGTVGSDLGRRRGAKDVDAFELSGNFNLAGWQNTYQNARIPVKAMAKVPGTSFLMEPHAAQALAAMFKAARADGVDLSIGNTYRDYATQARMYQAHISGNHPAPVASPGTSNHGWGLAVDISSVDNARFQWLLQHAQQFGFTNPWIDGKGDRDSVEPWHWEYGGGGDLGAPPTAKRPSRRGQHDDDEPEHAAPYLMLDDLDEGAPAFSAVLASLMQPVAARTSGGNRTASSSKGGSTTAQLRSGFSDAGRVDLAKMVGTKDFQTWINAESGGRVDAVSQSFPGHGRNYGLFQFWEGHAWTENYLNSPTSWTADAYTQAKLVARYFSHLTPADIHNYAAQIRNGTYSGWG